MNRSPVTEQLDTVKQLLQEAHAFCGDGNIEEENERQWRASEKKAGWEELQKQVENIRAHVRDRTSDHDQKTSNTDFGTLLDIVKQNHNNQISRVITVLEDSKKLQQQQQAEIRSAIEKTRRTRR